MERFHMIKILLVDHEGITSEGLRFIIDKEEDLKFLGVQIHEKQVLKTAKEEHPDIILVHVQESYTYNLKLTKKIKEIIEGVKIIYILSIYDEALIIKGFKAGVEGFFLSQLHFVHLVHMIHMVYSNHYVLPKEVKDTIMKHFRKTNPKKHLNSQLLDMGIQLTQRELDIVYLLYKQKKNIEIAQLLDLKEKTVRDYVSAIYKKLGVNKRALAINLLTEIMESD